MSKNTNQLRVLRAGKGLSQLDTALKAGIKHYRYWRIENGYEEPTDREVAALSRVFKVEPSAVFQTVGTERTA